MIHCDYARSHEEETAMPLVSLVKKDSGENDE